MTEQWRPVVGREGSYEVSDHGNVRSVDRIVTASDGRSWRQRGRVLATEIRQNGHVYVKLGRRDIRQAFVHCLVLEAFVSPCPAGLECCHGNGDPADNRLVNLRWDTKSANAADSVLHGTHNATRRPVCFRSHLLIEPNLTAAGLAIGRRQCLACSRTRSTAYWRRQHGMSIDRDAYADEQYRLIMALPARVLDLPTGDES